MRVSLRSWLLLIFLSLVWGSSFILMKRGLAAFSSVEVAAARIALAFIFLSPLLIRHYRIDLKKYAPGLLIMGIFGNLIPAFLFTAAETRISSSLAGMLNSLTPLFAVLVAMVWLKLRPEGSRWVGLVIGFLAACGLLAFDKSNNVFNNFGYGSLVVIATLCYAISVNGIRKYLSDISSVKATVWAFTLTGPPSLVYLLFFTDFRERFLEPGASTAFGYVIILAFGGTALSVILFNVLIKDAGVLFASSCTYLIPVVAVFWGLAENERITGPQILCMAAIILSVYLLNRQVKRN